MPEEIEETSQLAARPAVKETQSFLLSFFCSHPERRGLKCGMGGELGITCAPAAEARERCRSRTRRHDPRTGARLGRSPAFGHFSFTFNGIHPECRGRYSFRMVRDRFRVMLILTRLFPAATTHWQSSRTSRRQRARRGRRRPPRNPPPRLASTTAPYGADRSENAPGGKYAFAAPLTHHVVIGRRCGVVVVVVCKQMRI